MYFKFFVFSATSVLRTTSMRSWAEKRSFFFGAGKTPEATRVSNWCLFAAIFQRNSTAKENTSCWWSMCYGLYSKRLLVKQTQRFFQRSLSIDTAHTQKEHNYYSWKNSCKCFLENIATSRKTWLLFSSFPRVLLRSTILSIPGLGNFRHIPPQKWALLSRWMFRFLPSRLRWNYLEDGIPVDVSG